MSGLKRYQIFSVQTSIERSTFEASRPETQWTLSRYKRPDFQVRNSKLTECVLEKKIISYSGHLSRTTSKTLFLSRNLNLQCKHLRTQKRETRTLPFFPFLTLQLMFSSCLHLLFVQIGNFSGLKIVSSIVQTVKINFILQPHRKKNKFNWNLYLWSFQKKNFSLIFLAHKKASGAGVGKSMIFQPQTIAHNTAKTVWKDKKHLFRKAEQKKISHCWARLCWTYVITSGGNDEVWNHETFSYRSRKKAAL